MMKKTMVAVALLMVSGVVVAGDEHATCSKGMVSCAGRTIKKYGFEKPKAAVETAVSYGWNGKHSGSTVAVWGDRTVRLAGLLGLIYHGLVPASSKAYAFVSAQVKALKAARK